jgi:hypothetical protein
LTVPAGATLVFDPTASRTVTATGNVVVNGTLRMRPNTAAQVHALRFANVNEALFVGGGMTPVVTDVGLWVVGMGVLDTVGADRQGWNRAATGIAQGDQIIALESAPTGWQVGDTLAIVPTRQGTHTEYDTVTIASIVGPLVTLSAPCQFSHPAVTLGDGMIATAEVLNLTRNVVIEGTTAGRAHVFISTTGPQTIANVELRRLGPRKPSGRFTLSVTGRYPLHFHMMADASRGSTVTNVVAHTCGNRAFVPHGSHGIVMHGCVAHDTFDHAFWWDGPGNPAGALDASNDITWSSCVASRVRRGDQGYGLSGFLIAADGTGNTMVDCVAVGVEGQSNAAGIRWQGPRWATERLVAHNNQRHGHTFWLNNEVGHQVVDFVAYHNGGAGILHGAYSNNVQWLNGYVAGNTQAAVLLPSLGQGTMPNQPTITYRSIDMRGSYPHHVVTSNHPLQAHKPGQFESCRFSGHTVSAVKLAGTTYPDWWEFVECAGMSWTWDSVSLPTALIRVQNGATAVQSTPAGDVPVAPFSSWTDVPPAPFVVAVP